MDEPPTPGPFEPLPFYLVAEPIQPLEPYALSWFDGPPKEN